MYYDEDDIDEMIYPIVERQIEINTFILIRIAQRIKHIGELLPSDVQSLEQLAMTGADVRAINKKLAEVAQVQVKEIKKMIRNVAENIYDNAKPFFDYRKKPFIPFKENEPIQRVVKAIEKETSGTYMNMARAQAYMVRDPRNPKVLLLTTPARTYQNSVDKAIQTVQTGTQDYQTTMRDTLKELSESGLKEVQYETEDGKIHTQRMDTAVRRNLMDGVSLVGEQMQQELGKQFGADGVEISVHKCPAPDHEHIQGRQLTLAEYAKIAPKPTIQQDGSIDNSVYELYKIPKDEDFDEHDDNNWVFDVNGKRYTRFSRRIGTCNCMHFPFMIIIGKSAPNYTDKELQDIMDNNKKGVTVNGKHYTLYEATQMQRKLETKIRRAKDEQMTMVAAGDKEGIRQAQDKIKQYTREYKEFSAAAGLRPKMERTKVDGYKRVKI